MKLTTKFKQMIKSYSFWTTLAGSLALIASAIGKAFSIKVEEKIIIDIVMAIAGVLVAVGVITMPSDKSKTDEKEDASKEEIVKYDPSKQGEEKLIKATEEIKVEISQKEETSQKQAKEGFSKSVSDSSHDTDEK